MSVFGDGTVGLDDGYGDHGHDLLLSFDYIVIFAVCWCLCEYERMCRRPVRVLRVVCCVCVVCRLLRVVVCARDRDRRFRVPRPVVVA